MKVKFARSQKLKCSFSLSLYNKSSISKKWM